MARNMSRRRRVVEDDDYDDKDERGRDDEPEEEPRRSRRRSSRDDEPDDEPRGRRSRRSRDDEPEEEPRGRRSRRSRDDEDDEPRGRSRRSSRDDDDAPRGRSSRRSRRDDEDDEPRSRREKAVAPPAGKGWSGAQEVKTGGDFADNFTTEAGKEVVVKILDAEPFYNYREHWINEMGKGKRKSFVCLREDCPLCDIGDKASGYSLFNVVDLTKPDRPEVKVWKCGSKNTGVLENYAKSSKDGPLDRDDLYFGVLKTGSQAKGWQTTIRPIKSRDLDEDWDIEPLTSDEIEEFYKDGFEADQYITTSTRRELKDIARQIED